MGENVGICANCHHSAGHHRLYRKSCSFQNSCECQKFVTPAPSPTDLPDAETAWREWLKANGLNDGSSQRPSDVFLAGYRSALEDAADDMEAQKPEGGYVVVYPERVGAWLRARAAAADPRETKD